MSDKRPEDLSVNELRRLLLDKRRVSRKDRLERFRRTGRVVALTPEAGEDTEEQRPLGRGVGTLEIAASPAQTAGPIQESRRLPSDSVPLPGDNLALAGL